MFGATGAGLAAVKGIRNDGKKPRWNIDQWDKVRSCTEHLLMQCASNKILSSKVRSLTQVQSSQRRINIDHPTVMDRDRRLTGSLRGQCDNPIAPQGFELNNPWRVCCICEEDRMPLMRCKVGEKDFVRVRQIPVSSAAALKGFTACIATSKGTQQEEALQCRTIAQSRSRRPNPTVGHLFRSGRGRGNFLLVFNYI